MSKFKLKKGEKYIFATDLDGTFLPSEGKQISDRSKEIVDLIHELGHIFLPVTGRDETIVEENFLKGFKLKNGGIYYSGSKILLKKHHDDFVDKTNWKHISINKNDLIEMINSELVLNNALFYAANSNTLLDFSDKEKNLNSINEFLNKWDEIFEFAMIYDNTKFDVAELVENLRNLYGNKFEIRHFKNWRKFRCTIQISSKNVHKKSALKKVAKYFNVPKENIIFFGDNANDLEALEWAGHGVAMKNASPEAKEKASYILEWTNDDDGVVKHIEYLLKNIE